MLRPDATGTLISLRVTTRAAKNAITGIRNNVLAVAVRAAPNDGQANSAVIETLANSLGVPKSRLELIRGQKSREKVVRVVGLSPDETRERLSSFLT